MKDIKISNYIMKKIRKFADDRIKSSEKLYAARGEARVEKMIEDIVIGTAGEYAVWQLLKSQGLKCTKPDLTIYTAKQKSFKADLDCSGFKIHVKSQSVASAERYGYSWLCQRYDALFKSPKPEDLFAFCCVDLATQIVTFLGFCAAQDIKTYDLWRECKVPIFRRTKVALYLEHFADYDILRAELPDEDVV